MLYICRYSDGISKADIRCGHPKRTFGADVQNGHSVVTDNVDQIEKWIETIESV